MTTTTIAVATAPGTGSQLFQGLSFFLSISLPQRSNYKELIENHGGRVLRLEGHENYKIGDHLRRPFIPGFHSYTFIDTAIRNGQLPDPDEHKIASNSPPQKGRNQTRATRTPFTPKDDRDLVEFVEHAIATRQSNNIGPKGIKVYEALAELNRRHTKQSWRSRYIGFSEADIARIKASGPSQSTQTSSSTDAVSEQQTQAQRPPSQLPHSQLQSQPPQRQQNAAQERPVTPQNVPTPSSGHGGELSLEQQRLLDEVLALKPAADMTKLPFTANEVAHLVINFDSVKEIQEDRLDEAWEAFAASLENTHSAADWASLCYNYVEPIHARLQEERMRALDAARVQRAATLPPLDIRSHNIPPPNQAQGTTKRKADAAQSSPAKRQQLGPKIDQRALSIQNRMSEPPIERVRRTPEMQTLLPLPEIEPEESSRGSSPLMRASQPSDQRLQWTFDQALHKKRTEDNASVVSQSSHRLTAQNLASQFEQQSAELADDARSVAVACMQYVEETRRHTAPASQPSSKSSGRRQFVSSQETVFSEEQQEPEAPKAISSSSSSEHLPSESDDIGNARLSQDASRLSQESMPFETCREQPVERSPERRLPDTIQDSNSQSPLHSQLHSPPQAQLQAPHSQSQTTPQSQSQSLSLGSGYSQLRFFEPDLGIPSPAKVDPISVQSKSQSPLFMQQSASPQVQCDDADNEAQLEIEDADVHAATESESSQDTRQDSDGSTNAFASPPKDLPPPASRRSLPWASTAGPSTPAQHRPQPSSSIRAQVEPEIVELSDDSATSPSTHNAPAFPQPSTDVQGMSKLDKFKMTYEKKGVPAVEILSALRRTTANMELAGAILLAGLHNYRIPANQPGIWSREEDAIVVGSDVAKREMILQKHGPQRCLERQRFLYRLERDHSGRF